MSISYIVTSETGENCQKQEYTQDCFLLGAGVSARVSCHRAADMLYANGKTKKKLLYDPDAFNGSQKLAYPSGIISILVSVSTIISFVAFL